MTRLKPNEQRIEVDGHARQVSIRTLPPLSIEEVSVTIPFHAIKTIAGNIAVLEAQLEQSGALHYLVPATTDELDRASRKQFGTA